MPDMDMDMDMDMNTITIHSDVIETTTYIIPSQILLVLILLYISNLYSLFNFFFVRIL